MDLNVLRTFDCDQKQEWLQRWKDWPKREIWAHPDYVQLFVRSGEEALCLAMGNSEKGALMPLISRPLELEVWGKDFCGCIDLVSPYGYGGVFSWGGLTAKEFWTAADQWALANGAVILFLRLSLFPEQLLPITGQLETKSCNVVRNLEPSEESIWMDYEHKVRKNVKRARESGLVVRIDDSGEGLDQFLGVYEETMKRRNANAWYFFSKEFFDNLVLKLHGQFVFFYIMNQSQVISCELVLLSQDHAYSYLGGTIESAFHLRPNDLLKHEVILWAKRNGKRTFVLGGGYANMDGIYNYKLSFSPTGNVPFQVLKKIYDETRYFELILARQKWEARNGNNWKPREEYFPSYRS